MLFVTHFKQWLKSWSPTCRCDKGKVVRVTPILGFSDMVNLVEGYPIGWRWKFLVSHLMWMVVRHCCLSHPFHNCPLYSCGIYPLTSTITIFMSSRKTCANVLESVCIISWRKVNAKGNFSHFSPETCRQSAVREGNLCRKKAILNGNQDREWY